MSMKRLATWIVILAVVAGLAWWQRASVVPFLVSHVPASTALIEKIPGLAEYTKPKEPADAAAPAGKGGGRRGAGGPVAVVLASAQTQNLPVPIPAVGSSESFVSIAIKPRVDSQVVTVDVAEGAKVNQGDRLFTLDDRATKAQLAQIEAQIERDKAQIAQAQADLARAEDLLRRNAGNAVTRETAQTALKVAEARRAGDEANRDAMQTTLIFTVITAPVSGRIGSIPVKPGSIVRAGDTGSLATVNQVDPSLVAFAIPGKRLPDLRTAMAKGPVKVEVAIAGQKLAGEVSFVENSIDVATGTITVKAKVPNDRELLWPGAYVTVAVVLDGGE